MLLQKIIDKIGYMLANPVAAGLVRYASDWPGAKSHPNDLGGGTMTAARPTVYLDPARWPETAELTLALPVGIEEHQADAWRGAVEESLAEHEARGRASVERKGWKFLGAERAERVSPYDRATIYEAIRGRNPTFAVSGVAGAYAAAVRALRDFQRAYAEARARWRAGFREVVFPAGTWWMARGHSAVVAASPQGSTRRGARWVLAAGREGGAQRRGAGAKGGEVVREASDACGEPGFGAAPAVNAPQMAARGPECGGLPRLMRGFGASPVSGGFDTNLNVGRVAQRGSGR